MNETVEEGGGPAGVVELLKLKLPKFDACPLGVRVRESGVEGGLDEYGTAKPDMAKVDYLCVEGLYQASQMNFTETPRSYKLNLAWLKLWMSFGEGHKVPKTNEVLLRSSTLWATRFDCQESAGRI